MPEIAQRKAWGKSQEGGEEIKSLKERNDGEDPKSK